MRSALSRSGVSVREAAQFTLRGYIVASREGGGNTKVSYIWDIHDQTGKRVNRITGEEVVKSESANDPWGSVSPVTVQTVVSRTASSVAAWLGQNRTE